MRHFFYAIVSSILLVFSNAAFAQLEIPTLICSNTPVPEDSVITQIIEPSVCVSPEETFVITKFENKASLAVCSLSNVPSGWVVTRVSSVLGQCGSGFSNVFTITNTLGLRSLSSCQASNLPEGWVITGVGSNLAVCSPSGFAPSYTIVNSA
jgi:hypothetical protein